MLADSDDNVLSPHRDFAEESDAPKDGVNLLDLFIELLDERLEEIELLLHETHRHVLVPLADRADDLIDPFDIRAAGRFSGRHEVVGYAGERRDDDDRMKIAPLRDDVDGIGHAIGVADGSAAEFDHNHRTSLRLSSCRVIGLSDQAALTT